jgi:3-oxoacyl-[acyl-carrier protein] reductase
MHLTNKVTLITGGGSGIGRASCLAFAQAGARVVVVGRTLGKVEAVAAEIRAAGGEALAIEADVSQGADVQRMIAAAVKRFGGLDVLFNNAGVSPVGSVTEISEAEWDECMAIDLRSVFLGAKYAIPELRTRGGGVILSTAGTFGLRAARNKAAYSAAKAGVVNLTRAIALDYARDNIRCNVICPGYVDTPLNEGFDVTARDQFLDRYQPLPGIIQADEVASLAVYLASDAAKMITGQMFVVDAGQQAGMY